MGDPLKKARDAARAKRYAEAAAILESVLGEDPQNLRALDLAGYVEFFRGNAERAEDYCRRALEIRPDHAYALSGLGSSLSRQGRIDGLADRIRSKLE